MRARLHASAHARQSIHVRDVARSSVVWTGDGEGSGGPARQREEQPRGAAPRGRALKAQLRFRIESLCAGRARSHVRRVNDDSLHSREHAYMCQTRPLCRPLRWPLAALPSRVRRSGGRSHGVSFARVHVRVPIHHSDVSSLGRAAMLVPAVSERIAQRSALVVARDRCSFCALPDGGAYTQMARRASAAAGCGGLCCSGRGSPKR